MDRVKKIDLVILLRDRLVDELRKKVVSKEEVRRIRILMNNIIKELENEKIGS